MTGYLPGDPRYGLSGEALRNYYRTKSAQWAIYCWDKPGTAETRRGLVEDQNSYVKSFGDRVIGYGHFALARTAAAASRASPTALPWSSAVNLPCRRRIRPSTMTVSTFAGSASDISVS